MVTDFMFVIDRTIVTLFDRNSYLPKFIVISELRTGLKKTGAL